MQIFGQRDPQWSGHALGSGAGEMGPYGCDEVCDTMIAYDAYGDMHYNPASMDEAMWGAGVFQGDLLPDNALERVWPDRFSTSVATGFDAARASAAVASPDTYVKVCIHNPAAGVTAFHFMILSGAGTVADPWWGKEMSFAAWGGPAVVVKTIYVKSLAAEREAAALAATAAAAAAVQAAADAKLKADTAAAAQVAAAAAQAKAEEAAAAAAAAQVADLAATAARAAAAQAAAHVVPVKAQPLVNPVQPTGNVLSQLLAFLGIVVRELAHLVTRR